MRCGSEVRVSRKLGTYVVGCAAPHNNLQSSALRLGRNKLLAVNSELRFLIAASVAKEIPTCDFP